MKKYSNNFFHNKNGALSIEFAFCFLLFSIFVFIIYDVYVTLMLQNKLERANYTVASVFRERSTLYQDKLKSLHEVYRAGLCSSHDHKTCYNSYELYDSDQVKEMRELASSLMNNREIAVRIEALFILQDPNNPGDLKNARLVATQDKDFLSCPLSGCNSSIKSYFNSLPAMNNPSSNYQQLAPYVPKLVDSSIAMTGRWVPIYRVSMCIVNEESLYLKWINSNRKDSDVMPNLCSSVVVLSRCNNAKSCPAYF